MLAASYNVFDNEELLEGSIKCIRDYVDHISVVYQTISYTGNLCSETLLPTLTDLKERGLIDELYFYKSDIKGIVHYNELEKHNIGLNLSRNSGCTHHICMDCDEYFISEEFKKMKDIVIDGDFDTSYCQMLSYYKTWEFILDPPEDYYGALIYKINPDTKYILNGICPVNLDPTRRVQPGKYVIFDRNEIQFHHGSYIRKDIRMKLENSAALVNFNKKIIDDIIKKYNNFKDVNDDFIWGLYEKDEKKLIKTKKIWD